MKKLAMTAASVVLAGAGALATLPAHAFWGPWFGGGPWGGGPWGGAPWWGGYPGYGYGYPGYGYGYPGYGYGYPGYAAGYPGWGGWGYPGGYSYPYTQTPAAAPATSSGK